MWSTTLGDLHCCKDRIAIDQKLEICFFEAKEQQFLLLNSQNWSSFTNHLIPSPISDHVRHVVNIDARVCKVRRGRSRVERHCLHMLESSRQDSVHHGRRCRTGMRVLSNDRDIVKLRGSGRPVFPLTIVTMDGQCTVRRRGDGMFGGWTDNGINDIYKGQTAKVKVVQVE